jgi:tetratricopeptide (TPR) repeat protein
MHHCALQLLSCRTNFSAISMCCFCSDTDPQQTLSHTSPPLASLTSTIDCSRAQVLYRLERYEEAIKEYRSIMKAMQDPSGEGSMEHSTNLIAAMVGQEVALRAEGKASSTSELPKGEGFETLCNTSCLLLARGRREEALKAIDAAIEDCREASLSSLEVPLWQSTPVYTHHTQT